MDQPSLFESISASADAVVAPVGSLRQLLERIGLGSLDPVSAKLVELAIEQTELVSARVEDLLAAVAASRTADDGRQGPAVAHVLVADDTEVNRLVALSQLERLGYSAEIVVDGAEAVERLTSGGIDAVLMDWHMPELDGLAAARAYFDHCAEHDIEPVPIIMMTASVSDEARAACARAGTQDFLPKPVSLEAMRTCLARWLPPGLAPAPTGSDDDATPATDVVDLGQIDVMIDELGGAESVVRVIDAFIADSDERRAAVQPGANVNRAEARRAVHTIKSTAALLGATPLSSSAKELESIFAAERSPDAEAIAAFGRLLDETIRRLGEIAGDLRDA